MRYGIRDQIRARFLARALDEGLASGACEYATPALELRARMLRRPSVSYELGSTLRRVLDGAHDRPSRRTRIEPAPGGVLAVEEDLRLLASRLQSPQPVAVATIAKVRLLLVDGTGPLYATGCDDALRAAVGDALTALDSNHVANAERLRLCSSDSS
jgi:hypothetical protein